MNNKDLLEASATLHHDLTRLVRLVLELEADRERLRNQQWKMACAVVDLRNAIDVRESPVEPFIALSQAHSDAMESCIPWDVKFSELKELLGLDPLPQEELYGEDILERSVVDFPTVEDSEVAA